MKLKRWITILAAVAAVVAIFRWKTRRREVEESFGIETEERKSAAAA